MRTIEIRIGDYKRYGEEWEREMMKWNKKELIKLLKEKIIKIEEYDELFDLQHERILEANKYWQRITNTPLNVHNDLGDLLKFLMNRIIELEKK